MYVLCISVLLDGGHQKQSKHGGVVQLLGDKPCLCMSVVRKICNTKTGLNWVCCYLFPIGSKQETIGAF